MRRKRTFSAEDELWMGCLQASASQKMGRQAWIEKTLQEGVWAVLKAPAAQRMGMVQTGPNNWSAPDRPAPAMSTVNFAVIADEAGKSIEMPPVCTCPPDVPGIIGSHDPKCPQHGHIALAQSYTVTKEEPGVIDRGESEEVEDYTEEFATSLGPITSAEYEVPGDWVDSAGVTRAQNLKRFGEDEAIEYWPKTNMPGMDLEAPLDVTALKGVA
jgi:hypothetical protein